MYVCKIYSLCSTLKHWPCSNVCVAIKSLFLVRWCLWNRQSRHSVKDDATLLQIWISMQNFNIIFHVNASLFGKEWTNISLVLRICFFDKKHSFQSHELLICCRNSYIIWVGKCEFKYHDLFVWSVKIKVSIEVAKKYHFFYTWTDFEWRAWKHKVWYFSNCLKVD